MDVLIKMLFADFDVTAGSGTFGSLLHLAVVKLQPEHVKIMLTQVNPDVRESIMDETPLHSLIHTFDRDPAVSRLIMQ
jgi:hypothetical protein